MSHVRTGVYVLTSGTAQEVADRAREGCSARSGRSLVSAPTG